MKLKTFLPLLCLLAACDVTQELQGQGQGQADGGSPSPAPTGTNNPQPTTDGGTSSGDGGTTTDGGPARPISVCVPKTSSGSASLVVRGDENGYYDRTTDIAIGEGYAFALSVPFDFKGAPLGGGKLESYAFTATLPNFVALALAPKGTTASGTFSTPALVSYDTPAGPALIALRGAGPSTDPEVAGRVIVDQGDIFFFEKKAPSHLVRAATTTSPSEALLVEYPSASNRIITGMSVIGSYVYFASAVTNFSSYSDVKLHRILRSGGAIEDLASIPIPSAIENIYEDGNRLYLTSTGEITNIATTFPIFDLQTMALSPASGSLQGMNDKTAYARTTNVAYDGTYFYYGSGGGGTPACGASLIRVPKSIAINHQLGSVDILVTNLDRIARLKAGGGAVYFGTSGDPFSKPSYRGQLVRWAP